MKWPRLNLVLLIAAAWGGLWPVALCLGAPVSEYQLKAAFMYNFLQFVEWPASSFPDKQTPYRLGILGDDPFGNAFDAIKDKQVNNRSIEIVRLGHFRDINPSELKNYHMLFVSASAAADLTKIIATLETAPTLTIGEITNFCESGGVINFVMEDNKVRFVINLTAAEKAGLKIRSKLLKLAKEIIGQKAPLPEKD